MTEIHWPALSKSGPLSFSLILIFLSPNSLLFKRQFTSFWSIVQYRSTNTHNDANKYFQKATSVHIVSNVLWYLPYSASFLNSGHHLPTAELIWCQSSINQSLIQLWITIISDLLLYLAVSSSYSCQEYSEITPDSGWSLFLVLCSRITPDKV